MFKRETLVLKLRHLNAGFFSKDVLFLFVSSFIFPFWFLGFLLLACWLLGFLACRILCILSCCLVYAAFGGVFWLRLLLLLLRFFVGLRGR